MKIVFMGTPDFAAGILDALVEAGHEITAVVTQPDRPKGRKKEPMPSPVKEEAMKLGLTCPIFQPLKIRREESVAQVLSVEADMMVVAAFGQIIPKSILDAPRFGCINVHASLLPAYRGASPIQTVMLDGMKETGVTIMRMDEGLDTGDIVSQCIIPIEDEDTGGSLFDKLAEEGAKLLVETIPSIEDGTATYTPQPAESTTPYAKTLKKEQGAINWEDASQKIWCQIRALNPWPSAYTSLDGKTLKVWKAGIIDPENAGEAEPGTILQADKHGMVVKTGDGALKLEEVQIEGKKRMAAADFLRGYQIKSMKLG
ncbi:MAG: methionyl-tRNA formyltransferase [Lachnospiraceae bacterium]|nr:methionyl-tRNA formyltransferase [Candidatus Equihabitans merdae]